jgi:hypothetical protein
VWAGRIGGARRGTHDKDVASWYTTLTRSLPGLTGQLA